jgi:DNA-binding NarL/FixJ family response regulator
MELAIPMYRSSASPGDVIAFDRRSATIRVLLAHEEGLARVGLRALLERDGDVSVVGEVARGEDAIAVAGELQPDVLLIDIRLPGLDALDVTRRILAAPDRARPDVLVLGSCDSDEQLFGALRAGAGGFLVKEAEASELLDAVRSVAERHAALSPRVTRRLIDEFASQPDPQRPVPERLEELTAREREVMELVAMGLTNHEIAGRLVVSLATAKTHVSRAMMKLHARDRAQLVALAYQTRLVRPRRPGDRPASATLLAA